MDVRDLGGHLDTTFHGWSSTLAPRVRLVISRLVLVSALPLDFHGRLRVLRSMFVPGVLHGIEAPGFDVEGASRRVAEEPDVWTDGSLVDDKMSGVSSAGARCFSFRVRRLWASWMWGHWDDDVGDGSVVPACRGFCSVPGPLQTVQRAELWGVILALQANDGVHLGLMVWV